MKTKIVQVMQQSNPGISRNIEDWKGQDIIEFQEDIQLKVNAYFSEKWFYNHFKTFSEKLPRIDLLNILSRYTGYIDWSDFKYKNRDKIPLINKYKGPNRIFYVLPAIALVVFIIALLLIKAGSLIAYKFCFVDQVSKEPVRNSEVEVTLLYDNESPLQLQCDPEGCFTVKTTEQRIKFLVTAPYYYSDTITRILNKAERNEEIQLKTDDYALMIYYFSNSKVDDWKKRREQLENIIADSAYICQVFSKSMMGMELYNKKEFIDLLTLPTSGLRNIEIIEMLYANEKITTLRFTQENKNE
ncbi:MAG: hypothetical protein JXB19_01695 [Bacteroidales bacterium]|nr:hypothetical protein [Bacteroidales bacterium]